MNACAIRPTKLLTRALINCPCEACVKARALGLFIDQGDGWATYFETPKAMALYMRIEAEVRTEARERRRRAGVHRADVRRVHREKRKVQRRRRKSGGR